MRESLSASSDEAGNVSVKALESMMVRANKLSWGVGGS